MKIYNTNIGKVKLRREQFNRAQTKSTNRGKKSLSKRIIAQRVEAIEEMNNFDDEFVMLMGVYKGDDLLVQIMYHLKFGVSTHPSIFNDNYLEEVITKLRKAKADFMLGIIDGEKYLEVLEIIDELISEDIHNLSRGSKL